SEQNKRKRRNGSRSDPLDGASADELHHRARDGAERASDRERDNADEIRATASPPIGSRSPDRHRYRRGEHVSRKRPRVQVGTAKFRQSHRHDRADDRVVETGENDREQYTEQDQHAALPGGIHLCGGYLRLFFRALQRLAIIVFMSSVNPRKRSGAS